MVTCLLYVYIEIASSGSGENLRMAQTLQFARVSLRPISACEQSGQSSKKTVGRVPHHIPRGFVSTVNVEYMWNHYCVLH